MKTIISSLLIIFSFNVFADDIYDRITDCENQADKNACVFKLLRELAARTDKPAEQSASVAEKNSGSQRCLVGHIIGQATFFFPISEATRFAQSATTQAGDNIADMLRQQWKTMGCDESSRVPCYVQGSQIVVQGQTPQWRINTADPKQVLSDLQGFMCL
jgi:hypothetical protein